MTPQHLYGLATLWQDDYKNKDRILSILILTKNQVHRQKWEFISVPSLLEFLVQTSNQSNFLLKNHFRLLYLITEFQMSFKKLA